MSRGRNDGTRTRRALEEQVRAWLTTRYFFATEDYPVVDAAGNRIDEQAIEWFVAWYSRQGARFFGGRFWKRLKAALPAAIANYTAVNSINEPAAREILRGEALARFEKQRRRRAPGDNA